MTVFVFFTCKCRNCSVASLQNINECYGCQDSKKSDLALEDIGADVILKCVTEYLGIKPLFLQKWSLRLAADKYETRGKQTYHQTGSKER